MGYIGVEPALGRNREVDDISSSFDGTTTQFNLTVQSLAVSPGSANGLLISVGGVVQNPNTDYTVNASQLTFTTAPASGLDFWGLMLGQGIDTQAVADGTITNSSISGSAAIALSKLATGALPTAITVTSANISDLSIVNADVNASAAIAGTKISPDFGSQGITTTGVISMGNGLTLTGTNPFIDIVDSNNNDDFTVKNDNGTFKIQDKTNSVDRFAIDSSGNVGIGTSSPSSLVHFASTAPELRLEDTDHVAFAQINAEGGNLRFDTDQGNQEANSITSFRIDGSEKMRIDSNGLVLVGLTSTLPSNNAKLQVAHTDGNADIIVHRAGNNANPPSLNFQKTRNASIGNYGTIVQTNDELGSIRWGGADGSNIGFAARIVGAVDGTPSANDMPGRIQFHTSSDGSESLTERMRIDSSGRVQIGTTVGWGSNCKLHVSNTSTNCFITISAADNGNSVLAFSDTAATVRGALDYDHDGDFLGIKTAGSERMRIDSSGNVGINTTSPSHSLEVNGNISLGNGGSSGGSEMLRLFNDSGVERIHATNNPSGLAFGIGGTASSNEAFRIDGQERVLINRTSAFSTGTTGTESAKLQVGISSTAGTAVGFADTGGFDTNVMVLNHARAGANSGAFSGSMIQFRNSSNTTVGGIVSGASSTTYGTSSDYRLKENEVLISDGITRLKQLKPYRFNFKTTPTITQDGFFAHEAQVVVPEAVSGTKDGMRPETYYEEGDELPSGKVVGDVKTYSSSEIDIQQLDYSQLVPLLTAALKEEISKRESLEARVAALEAA